jgi:hypothetical protein
MERDHFTRPLNLIEILNMGSSSLWMEVQKIDTIKTAKSFPIA